eukprot:TRINITY_DN16665_c0_g1_i1.p2 TRINITY_DN16665_c0_g1~~TRINITY_DN16665_c0_g1_i1.p2  ORF type:complete len:100 (+),score=23.57 TRINITY_DN16665_c0_g1_i1:257-556(+)
MDEKLSMEYKPTTRWPQKDSSKPSYSMETKNGVVFLRADHEVSKGMCYITVLGNYSSSRMSLTAKGMQQVLRAHQVSKKAEKKARPRAGEEKATRIAVS